LVVFGRVSTARADDVCASAYEESQVARSEGRLRAAQRELAACTRAECADFIRVDCARWLSEVEAALPTIVLRATDGGEDVTDVAVSLDSEPIASQLDGKAVAVDPGRHLLTFRRAGRAPVELSLMLREAEKGRPIVAELTKPPPAAERTAPAPPAHANGAGPWPWVLLGVGAAGVASFGVLGALGAEQRRDLERSCSPRCEQARIDEVRSKFLMADVSLAVGVLGLAGSGYLFWSSSRSGAGSSSPARPSAASFWVSGQAVSGSARWSF
jgi:hypothetical protein